MNHSIKRERDYKIKFSNQKFKLIIKKEVKKKKESRRLILIIRLSLINYNFYKKKIRKK